jgi:hypothetical protein
MEEDMEEIIEEREISKIKYIYILY